MTSLKFFPHYNSRSFSTNTIVYNPNRSDNNINETNDNTNIPSGNAQNPRIVIEEYVLGDRNHEAAENWEKIQKATTESVNIMSNAVSGHLEIKSNMDNFIEQINQERIRSENVDPTKSEQDDIADENTAISKQTQLLGECQKLVRDCPDEHVGRNVEPDLNKALKERNEGIKERQEFLDLWHEEISYEIDNQESKRRREDSDDGQQESSKKIRVADLINPEEKKQSPLDFVIDKQQTEHDPFDDIGDGG